MDVKEKLVEMLQHDNCPLFMVFGDKVDVLADYLIAHGVTVQEWISVKDRLPPPYTPVLTYRQSFGKNPPYTKVDQMVLLYGDDKVWTDDLGTWKTVVTHWMPLPQPPKGE